MATKQAKKKVGPPVFKPSVYEKAAQIHLDVRPRSKTLARDIASAVISELLKTTDKSDHAFTGPTKAFLDDAYLITMSGEWDGDTQQGDTKTNTHTSADLESAG